MVDFCFRNVIAAKKGPQKYGNRYNKEIEMIAPIGYKITYLIDITFLQLYFDIKQKTLMKTQNVG